MAAIQSWNNVLQYIKANLGVPVNLIELSDNEIVDYLKNHTLVEFSNYVPKKEYYVLSSEDLVDDTMQKYQIGVDKPIIDVTKVYTFESTTPSTVSNITMSKILDSVLFAKYESMLQSLSPAITWRFEQPNYLIFYTQDSIDFCLPALVEYCTVYDNLNEMPADMYVWFKKLCLADIKILLGNTRTKYMLSTPFGQIANNGDVLKQEGMQERQSIIETLTYNTPPDFLLEWVY